MTSESTDLLIIGAGPAGTAAAIEAVQAGLSVLVVDKARFPRQKCCGDGLTTGALRHLESLGLEPSTVPSWKRIDDVTLVSPRGRETHYRFPSSSGSYAVAARRSELDHALVLRARQVGAEIREETTLIQLDSGENAAAATAIVKDVSTGQETTITAPLVIAADGMWSPTRKLLGVDAGFEPYRGDWHAFRQYFTNVSERASSELIVWFDKRTLPGYVWSFPLNDGSANVGFGILRGASHRVQDMKQLWPQLLESPALASVLGPRAQPEGPHRAWPIPARLGQRQLAAGRVVFVGDAAAATDPMSGEGIGQAMETAMLAVRAFLDNGREAAPAIEQYQGRLRREMIRDHALARTLSTMLAKPWGAEAALAATGTSAWSKRNFLRWLFEDYPRAAAFNPERWNRSTFATEPAYVSAEPG